MVINPIKVIILILLQTVIINCITITTHQSTLILHAARFIAAEGAFVKNALLITTVAATVTTQLVATMVATEVVPK